MVPPHPASRSTSVCAADRWWACESSTSWQRVDTTRLTACAGFGGIHTQDDNLATHGTIPTGSIEPCSAGSDLGADLQARASEARGYRDVVAQWRPAYRR